MPRLAPLPVDHNPALGSAWDTFGKTLGFVPNSALILQRKPKLVEALAQLGHAVWDSQGKAPLTLRRLVGHVASRAHGCHY